MVQGDQEQREKVRLSPSYPLPAAATGLSFSPFWWLGSRFLQTY